MKEYGITGHLDELRNLEGTIKEQNQLKKEASQRIEEMLAKDREEAEQQRRLSVEVEKKEVTVR
jgi:hypothetical protein